MFHAAFGFSRSMKQINWMGVNETFQNLNNILLTRKFD